MIYYACPFHTIIKSETRESDRRVSGTGASTFKEQLCSRSDSVSMLKLTSILIRNGLGKRTLFISGGESDYKTKKREGTPPIRPRQGKLMGYHETHHSPAQPRDKDGLAGWAWRHLSAAGGGLTDAHLVS